MNKHDINGDIDQYKHVGFKQAVIVLGLIMVVSIIGGIV